MRAMADTAKGTRERLTLGEAAKELGWFPLLYAQIVGGPSVLSLLEMTFDDFRLIAILQWIVDGYNRITAVMARMIEPLFTPAIDWTNVQFGWQLMLNPHWRPLFLLTMVLITSLVRTAMLDGKGSRAVIGGVGAGVGALLGSILAGLVPTNISWTTQGFIAVLPLAGTVFFLSLLRSFADLARGNLHTLIKTFISTPLLIVLLSYICGGLIATLNSVSVSTSGTGVLGFASLVLCIGIGSLFFGFAKSARFGVLLGLSILGGYITAGLIISVDAVVKSLS